VRSRCVAARMHGELVAQCQDLVLYSGSRSEAGAERGDEARRTASILASYPVSGAWRDSIGCA